MELNTSNFFNTLIFHPTLVKDEYKTVTLIATIACWALSVFTIPAFFWAKNYLFSDETENRSPVAQRTDDVGSRILKVKVIIPDTIQPHIDRLFEGSAYKFKNLSTLPEMIDSTNPFDPQKMTQNVMKGMTEKGPCIAIKVTRKITNMDLVKFGGPLLKTPNIGDDIEYVILIGQWKHDRANMWGQLGNVSFPRPSYLDAFTDEEDGKIKDEKNFQKLQALIVEGRSKDVQNYEWQIPKTGPEKTLDTLLSGTDFEYDKLPFTTHVISDNSPINQDALTDNVMRGKSITGTPFIALKVSCKLKKEDLLSLKKELQDAFIEDPYLEYVLVLGVDPKTKDLKLQQLGQGQILYPRFFNQPITDKNGLGPTAQETINFTRFIDFLKKGEAKDLDGKDWRIVYGRARNIVNDSFKKDNGYNGLEELLKNSKYKIDKLPILKVNELNEISAEQLTHPVMKGLAPDPFIVIKLEGGKFLLLTKKENEWIEATPNPLFFSSAFIGNTGGKKFVQRENFDQVNNLLVKGSARGLDNKEWTLASS